MFSPQKQSDWFSVRNIPVHQTDYSDHTSLVNVLDSIHATALISFIQLTGSTYIAIHRALITACLQSITCKRFIPSEWTGNLDSFPEKPKFYHDSREPIRELLRQTKGLQWTLVNQGFFMDYFLTAEKTYLKPIPEEFPVDPNGWKVCIRGTGEEMQTFTMARDVAKAVVELLGADEWVCEQLFFMIIEEGVIEEIALNYIHRNRLRTLRASGRLLTRRLKSWRTSTVRLSISLIPYHGCSLQPGRPLPRTNISCDQIQRSLIEHEHGDPDKYVISQVDDWMVSGGCALPRQKTLGQKEKYFSKLNFVTLRELLERAEKMEFP